MPLYNIYAIKSCMPYIFSPTGTGTGTGGRVAVAPSSNLHSGPTEEYAAIQKPTRNVPHQTSATGEEYALSTKPGKSHKGQLRSMLRSTSPKSLDNKG